MSGSGLAAFFRGFLPPASSTDADPSNNNNIEDSNISEDPQQLPYQQSLVAIAETHRDEEGDNDNEEEEGEEEEGVVLDWQARRKEQKTKLAAFMKLRLAGTEEEEEEGDKEQEAAAASAVSQKSSPPENDDDNDESQLFETQQQQQQPYYEMTVDKDKDKAEGADNVAPPPPPRTNNSIPHVSETWENVSLLSELDLYCQSLTVNLCQVEKMWSFRETRRSKKYFVSNINDCNEIDGPLSVLYKTVASFELYQLQEVPVGELRRRIEQLHFDASTATSSSNSSIQVYFYNDYAKTFGVTLQQKLQAFQKQHANEKMYLYANFQNVPAKCVLPADLLLSSSKKNGNNSAGDWYRSNKYCLCIGSDSSMQVYTRNDENDNNNDEENVVEKVRFDDNDDEMSISFLAVCGPHAMEYQFAHGGARLRTVKSSATNNNTATTSSSDIQRHYQSYCRQNHGGGEEVSSSSAAAASTANHQTTLGETSAAAARGSSTTNNNGTGQHQPPSTGGGDATTHPTNTAATNNNNNNNNGRRNGTNHTTNGGARKRQRTYAIKFEKLNELGIVLDTNKLLAVAGTNPTCLVNLSCAVLSFTQPYRTKRGDWIMSIALVDKSLPLCENALGTDAFVNSVNINIFVKFHDKDTLPQVRYAGDVIELYNVKLQSWNGDVQLFGNDKSSYVVFRGNVNDPGATDQEPTILPTHVNRFVLTEDDKERMVDLWLWAQQRLMVHATMKLSHSFKLSEMRPQDSTHMEVHGDSLADARGDLTVMVAAIIRTDAPSHHSPWGFLRVWDGTGVPSSDSLPPNTGAAPEAVRFGDPPAQALVKIAEIINKLRFIRQNNDLSPPTQLSGRVANVAIWEKHQWEFIDNEDIVSVGSFIRLRNVMDSRMPGNGSHFRCLMVHEKSSFTPLPNLTYEVVHLLEEHNNRLLRREPANPSSGILPLDAEDGVRGADSSTNTAAVGASNHDIELRNMLNGQSELQQRQTSEQASGDARTNGYVTFAPSTPGSSCTRLQDLVSGPATWVFEGLVRIKGIHPSVSFLTSNGLECVCAETASDGGRSYKFGLRIEDDSGTVVDVLTGDSAVGQTVFGMSAASAVADKTGALYNIHSILTEQRLLTARVKSIVLDGAKYFVIISLVYV